jgi:hypothetical protein
MFSVLNFECIDRNLRLNSVYGIRLIKFRNCLFKSHLMSASTASMATDILASISWLRSCMRCCTALASHTHTTNCKASFAHVTHRQPIVIALFAHVTHKQPIVIALFANVTHRQPIVIASFAHVAHRQPIVIASFDHVTHRQPMVKLQSAT